MQWSRDKQLNYIPRRRLVSGPHEQPGHAQHGRELHDTGRRVWSCPKHRQRCHSRRDRWSPCCPPRRRLRPSFPGALNCLLRPKADQQHQEVRVPFLIFSAVDWNVLMFVVVSSYYFVQISPMNMIRVWFQYRNFKTLLLCCIHMFKTFTPSYLNYCCY
jgi:hypothetical protein